MIPIHPRDEPPAAAADRGPLPVSSVLASLAELAETAGQWNDLWERCEVTTPTARAEPLVRWLSCFAPQAPFRAVLVREAGRLVAALPLVGRKIGRLWNAGALPGNEWSPGGDLLVAPDASAAAMDALLRATEQLPWSVLWIDGAVFPSERWERFGVAAERSNLDAERRDRFSVGWVDLDPPWPEIQMRWSKNHRRNMRRSIEKLKVEGELSLRIESPESPHDVARLLRRAFEVELRSWKRHAKSAVLCYPSIFDFYVAQATELAPSSAVRVVFLELDDQPIAFEYGWVAKRVYHSFKVGYDERFAAFSPGQVLMHELIRTWSEGDDTSVRGIDCLGPISDAVEAWRPRSYSVSRLALARPRLAGRMILFGYRNIWPRVRRWRRPAPGS